jgi:hypothetical protein
MSRGTCSFALLSLLVATTSGVTLLKDKAKTGHHQPNSKACECLTWKDVYANYTIECGQGLELASAGGMTAKVQHGHQFCNLFYERLNNNYCTQGMWGTSVPNQWCYVTSNCQDLDGGAPVTRELSWKQCEDGVDTPLRTLKPYDLRAISLQDNVDAGILLKMAYPVWAKEGQGHLNWPEVEDFLNGTSPDQMTAIGVGKALQLLSTSDHPWVFDSLDGNPPYGVVAGNQIVRANMSNWASTRAQVQGIADGLLGTAGWLAANPHKQPKKMTQFTCLRGCENVPAAAPWEH